MLFQVTAHLWNNVFQIGSFPLNLFRLTDLNFLILEKKYPKTNLKIEPTEMHLLLELVQAEGKLVYFMLLLANLK